MQGDEGSYQQNLLIMLMYLTCFPQATARVSLLSRCRERCYLLHPYRSLRVITNNVMFKIYPINFSHERSGPLAAYRARIVPYNPFAFPSSMEVSVACNPSRPTIYSPYRHCRFFYRYINLLWPQISYPIYLEASDCAPASINVVTYYM